MPFERHYPSSKNQISRPLNYHIMVNIAEKLSIGISLVRVVFYELNNRVYVGEMTFYPGSEFE